MTNVTTIFCWLCIVMLFTETSTILWSRRRRRRRRSPPPPPPCQPSDCTVSSWSSWSVCSYPCGTGGTQLKSRSVTSYETCGGRSCPLLYKSRTCNTERWRCKNYGTPHSTGCHCRPGYTRICCDKGKFYNHLTQRSRKAQSKAFMPFISSFCSILLSFFALISGLSKGQQERGKTKRWYRGPGPPPFRRK